MRIHVWVAQKKDALLQATITRLPVLQCVPELQREVMEFCNYFAVVVATNSQRIRFADAFIVENIESAMIVVSACFFTKHPYVDDNAFLSTIWRRLGLTSDRPPTPCLIGNDRLYNCGSSI